MSENSRQNQPHIDSVRCLVHKAFHYGGWGVPMTGLLVAIVFWGMWMQAQTYIFETIPPLVVFFSADHKTARTCELVEDATGAVVEANCKKENVSQ